jgi:hypothetical protein
MAESNVQVPIFHFLTSWPLEDLLSPLNGVSVSTGALFDRLETAIKDSPVPSKRRSVTCVHFRHRNNHKRPPPRVLVFSGPPGGGKHAVMAGLVRRYPNLFARVVTHTTRRPREAEVDGDHYHFTDAPTLRCDPRMYL